jgi:hypothetical protein
LTVVLAFGLTHDEIVAGLLLIAVVAVIVAGLLYLIAIGLRKQQLLGRPGGIPLALRLSDENWVLGVASYSGDELLWYGAFRPGRRPTRVLRRAELEVTGQRGRRPNEDILPVGSVVVECTTADASVSLCLSAAAVTGFLSWLESSAPSF